MLDPSELESVREAARGGFDKVATVMRATTTPDGSGTFSRTWAAAGTYDCRMSAALQVPRELETAGRIGQQVVWMVSLPFDASITSKDRLVVSGTTYEVVASSGLASNAAIRVVYAIEARE